MRKKLLILNKSNNKFLNNMNSSDNNLTLMVNFIDIMINVLFLI
jgi:hypothetical protein